MLPVSIEPGHKCNKEVTALQKRAENLGRLLIQDLKWPSV
jgi:hypothetical protein